MFSGGGLLRVLKPYFFVPPWHLDTKMQGNRRDLRCVFVCDVGWLLYLFVCDASGA